MVKMLLMNLLTRVEVDPSMVLDVIPVLIVFSTVLVVSFPSTEYPGQYC